MINRWLSWINFSILAIIILLSIALFYFWITGMDEIVSIDPQTKQGGLPKGAFELEPKDYDAISAPFLTLTSSLPTLQLPDLKSQLVYHGRNGRPDAQLQHVKLHFSFVGNRQVYPINLEEKMYIIFDKAGSQLRYNFSPNNEPTNFWFKTSLTSTNQVHVQVGMLDEKGQQVVEPENHLYFLLPEKDFVKAGEVWEIGTYRVDGTLLSRMKARWYGRDRFLESHGGKEFENIENKQRIDFGEGENLYYVFVKAGDCLIWKNERWQVIAPGEESLKYPLLVVKKVDDRLISFELWDVDGKSKVLLNLLKSNEPWAANNVQAIQQTFKFVGARTRTQSLFEINKVRMVIRPGDWLLMTQKGWKKLESATDIDNYVQRKSLGMLFIFDGWKDKEDRHTMLGTLYNSSRNDSQVIELTMQNAKPKKPVKKAIELEDDEDDEDDDELIEQMLSSLKQNKNGINANANADKEPQTIKKQLNQKQAVKSTVQTNNIAKKIPVSQKNQKK